MAVVLERKDKRGRPRKNPRNTSMSVKEMSARKRKDVIQESMGIYRPIIQKYDLKPKEALFALEWIRTGFNVQAAYEVIRDKRKKLKTSTYDLAHMYIRQHPGVVKAAKEILELIIDEYKPQIKKEMIDRWWIMATYDLTDFFDASGVFKYKPDLSDMPEEKRRVFGVIWKGAKRTAHGQKADVILSTHDFVDREKAMEKLSKWTDLLSPDITVNNTQFNISFEAEENIKNILGDFEVIPLDHSKFKEIEDDN